MVAGPAAAQAVMLARATPSLRVGLHLVLVEGIPASPPEEIPDLIDREGMLRTDMVRLARDIALRPRARRQLRREITAQFELFRRTGLPLDHVNAHKHFHVHPLIATDVLKIGREYGMKALRVPYEPAAVVSRAESAAIEAWTHSRHPEVRASAASEADVLRGPRVAAGFAQATPVTAPPPQDDDQSSCPPVLQPRERPDPPHLNPLPKGERERTEFAAAASTHSHSAQKIMSPWNALLRTRARRAGLTTPDAVFGLRFTGALTAGRLRGILNHLPDGLIEIYTHPASTNSFAGHVPGYRYAEELQALTDPEVIEALRRSGRRLRGYADTFATPLDAADSLSLRTSGSRL
jgi:predicted glycoside hydrolase/deacetylase ChbG (UPF0249 family)